MFMKKISEKDAIRLLKKYSQSKQSFKRILGHVQVVKKLAVDIGKKVKDADLDFIKTASLLHDIGRFQVGPDTVRHGVIGSEILRGEGLPDHALVAERHLGPGISKEEIIEHGLDLPVQDYIPVSREEKIICHADNLIFGHRKGTLKEAVERFNKELGKKVGRKVKKLAEEVEGMSKK